MIEHPKGYLHLLLRDTLPQRQPPVNPSQSKRGPPVLTKDFMNLREYSLTYHPYNPRDPLQSRLVLKRSYPARDLVNIKFYNTEHISRRIIYNLVYNNGTHFKPHQKRARLSIRVHFFYFTPWCKSACYRTLQSSSRYQDAFTSLAPA